MMPKCVLLGLSVGMLLGCSLGQGLQASTEQLASTFINLNRSSIIVRPGLDSGGFINMYIGLVGARVASLNLKDQVLSLSGVLHVTWTDERLAWEPSAYGNVTRLAVPQSLVWRPDVVFFNEITDNFDAILSNDHHLVSVKHDGSVRWSIAIDKRFRCRVNPTKYPFDANICPIEIVPWESGIGSTNFHYSEELSGFGNLEENNEFTVTLHSAGRIVDSYDDVQYSYIKFEFRVARRPVVVIMSLMLPISALSVLCSLSFLLSPEQADRLTLSITSLLSVTVFLGTVDDTLPQNADNVPYLAIYVCLVFCHAFLTVLGNVFVLVLVNPDDGAGSRQDRPTSQNAVSPVEKLCDNAGSNQDALKKLSELKQKEACLSESWCWKRSQEVPVKETCRAAKINTLFLFISFISSLVLAFVFFLLISLA